MTVRSPLAPIIEALLAQRGIGAKRFAKENGMGESAVRDILEGRSLSPRHDTIEKIAAGFGMTAPALIALATPGGEPASGRAAYEAALTNVVPAPNAPDVSPGALPRDVPILGTAVGGANGDFELNGEIVDMARRPPALAGMKSIFALYVAGDSMSPAFEPGDLVFLQRSRHPAPGDYVVVEMKPRGDDGEVRPALLKRFAKIAGDTLILQQFNPPMDLPVPRAHVLYVYRVFRNNELYGL